ncbi:MAG: 2-isopropylmalate synthase [Candidatus Micrarchaeota archaeon]
MGKYNDLINPKLNLAKKISVFDSTLRDGEQVPGVSFKLEEKLEIARALDKLGVDIIEAGFPVNSKPEFEAVKKIANEKLDAVVCGLARVKKEDMDACINADVGLVHVFVSTSDLHLKYQMGKTREEVLRMAVDAVEYVKEHGRKCLFSAMDSSRTELSYLKEVCKGAEDAGADIINLPDTVGVLHPSATRYLIGEMRKVLKVPIDMHCHNDFGLAVANTLAGVEAGANEVQVTINGMGERAGNASLEQVVMSLEALYNVKTNIKTEFMTEVSQLVEKYSEAPLPPFWPLVGKNSFAHESGIHAHAVLKCAETFEPLRPEMVGQKRRIVIGKHSGKASIESALNCLDYKNLSQEQVLVITKRIKEVAEIKKRIYDEDIRAIADDVIGHVGRKEPSIVLDEITVVSGNKITPTASVALKFKNEMLKGAGQGVGPVDAAANAIQAILGKHSKIKLKEYNLRAITGGTDALADVTIKIADEKGREFLANAVHEDIVMASVQALIRAINDSMAKK